MAKREFNMHDGKHGAALAVRVTPRSSRSQIVEVMHDGTVKIHIAAPPVEGRANEELIKFLADVLGVAKSRIEIVAGVNGRDKLVSVLNMDTKVVHDKIIEHLG